MRRDIEIHINTGDLHLANFYQGVECVFQWISNPDGMVRYIYGEVTVPENLSIDAIMRSGVSFSIPYTPIYKEVKICIRRGNANSGYVYIQNSVDGSSWFTLQTNIFGESRNIFASELKAISSRCQFHCMIIDGHADIYSAGLTDFNIIEASRQNSNLILACVPTNNYRYPITGVGLIKWVRGNLIRSGLADRLKQEFADDGTPVIDANYDFNTQQLNLQLDKNTVD